MRYYRQEIHGTDIASLQGGEPAVSPSARRASTGAPDRTPDRALDFALDRALADLGPQIEVFRAWRREGGVPLLALPRRTDDLSAIDETARRYRDSFADVLVLGTGGSSLGAETLVRLARDPKAPRVHCLDSIDPEGLEPFLDSLDWGSCGLLIVSKSGGTAETLAQTFALLPRLEAGHRSSSSGRAVTVITDPCRPGAAESPLRRLARARGWPILDHEPAIGGRFAALTNVGLLPAAMAGLDPRAIRDGAAWALDQALGEDGGHGLRGAAESPPALGAALAHALWQARGITQTVLVAYRDRLEPFTRWYRQLWAESLGKGGKGTTPIAARGPVDQHSQLQLWLDGPDDKMFTLLLGDPAATGPLIEVDPVLADSLSWLSGRRLGALLAAEQEATRETLVTAGRPVRCLRIQASDAGTVGALMMHFMLETLFAAHLFAVDPYDQPAVEEGKILARDALARLPSHAPVRASGDPVPSPS